MTVEEAKFYPTPDRDPAPLEPGELPASYGKNRLVLLPVDPYQIYAYWELAADPPPTDGARPVLRFHETPGRPFDVEIDLGAGNWYVHLWSAGKLYQADLGVRSEDGSFAILAQSNVVQTPSAGPMPATQEPVEEVPVVPDVEALPAVPEPEPPPALVVVEVAEVAIEETQEAAAVARVHNLAEIFASEGELPLLPEPYLGTGVDFSSVSELDDDVPAEPIPFDLGDLEELDLTEYSEQRFTPGVSSEVRPLGK